MDVVKKTLVFALLLTLVIERSSAVECYECISLSISDTDTCANPVDGTTPTTECEGECQTIFTYTLGSITAVTRTCVSTCIETEPVFGTGFDTKCCDTDKCNSESATSPGDDDYSCYACTWPGEDNCLSPSDSTSTCSGSQCSTTATYEGDDLTSLARVCLPVCVESDTTVGGVRTTITCCEGDNCNSKVYSHSGQIVLSFVALFISVTAAIYNTAL